MHEVSDYDVMRWLFGEASKMFVAAQTTGDGELRAEFQRKGDLLYAAARTVQML